jgi:hypothetical protein
MKTFIVIGMRSGTSITAGIMHMWGIDMGLSFRGPDSNNETGYYEDSEMLRAVTSIIGNRFERAEQIQCVDVEQLRQFKDLIEGKKKDLWGFKAPGACFMVNVIDMLVPNPHYIVCTRNPKDMAASLEKIKTHALPKGFNHLKYCEMWQKTIDEVTRNKRRITIPFEGLVKYPQGSLKELIDFLNIAVDEDKFNEGVRMVNPSLRHHASDI